MNFNDFKKKYFGKDLKTIVSGLEKEENFWKKDKEVVSICLDIDEMLLTIKEMDKTYPSLFLFKKKMLLYKYILSNFTTLRDITEEESFEDYDIAVEEALYTLSSEARFVKKMLEEGIEELRFTVVSELKEAIGGLPITEDEINKLSDSMENLFKNMTPEDSKMIQDVLAFNDPALKEIKDMLYDTKSIISEKNKNEKEIEDKKNVDKAKENIIKDTEEKAKNITQLINESPIIKEVNTEIQKEQEQRVLEYAKQLEKNK